MTWEDVVTKFHSSPTIHDIAPSLAAGRPLSPSPAHAPSQTIFTHDPQEMDIDSNTPPQHRPGRTPLGESRHRTPLPSGPRLEKSLSLPGIENLKNELQSNASRMLSTSSRSRYTAVYALLLFWQDDDDVATVHHAVRELADVLDNYYHYTLQTKTIPSLSDGTRSSWRWLSRELNAFAEERDQRDVLKIVYYAGHTYLDGNREMVLARCDQDIMMSFRIAGFCQANNTCDTALETPRALQQYVGTASSRSSRKPVRIPSSSWMPRITHRPRWSAKRACWS